MLEHRNLVGRDLADNAYAEPRPGERLAPHDLIGQSQLSADLANLILEQGSQRLHQFELHIVGQATNIVMTLDLGGVLGARFDDIGIQGSLDEELSVLNAAAGVLEYSDEEFADGFALCLGFGDPGQSLEETIAGPHMDEFYALMPLEGFDNLFTLALTHQAGIDEHTGELRTNRPMHERGGNGRINTTGQTADRSCTADLRTDELNLGLDDGTHGPRRGESARVVEEVFEHFLTMRRVHDLWVELHAVATSSTVLVGRSRGVRC